MSGADGTVDSGPRDSRARQAARVLLPPLAAFLAARLLLWSAAASDGFDAFDPLTWARWDSGHYLSLARDGYEWYRCPSPPDPDGWCGTAGWFPLYPLFVAAADAAGFSLFTAAVVVAAVFHYLALVLVWVFLSARATRGHLLCLALAAVFPGTVYFGAAFPIATAVAFAALSLVFLRRGQPLAAGAAGALATAAYPTAVLVAAVVFAHTAWSCRPDWRRAARRAVPATLLVVAGFGAVIAAQRVQTGSWTAYLRTQAQYDYGLSNPVGTAVSSITSQQTLATTGLNGDGSTRALQRRDLRPPRIQSALVAGLVVAVALAAWRRRRLLCDADRVAIVYGAAAWGVPLLLGGNLARYRSEALLLPAVILTRHLHWAIQGVAVAVSAVVSWQLAALFFGALLQ